MRFSTLNEWLVWQESLHAKKIDLGLDRIAQVLQAMGRARPPCPVITVGGTNGKGSSVALLDAICRAAGYRVGTYTSPYLLRYNERVKIQGEEASDESFCAAFDIVDQARGATSLTYFEFGTLAAFELLHQAEPDIVILEIGMGGRLDAVNLYDPDVALVTNVGLDHIAYLGPDRESIGREKAGIFRSGRPAVCGDPDPPRTLVTRAEELAAPLYRFGRDYGYTAEAHSWWWWGPGQGRRALPYPNLLGPYQLINASGVLMALDLLGQRFPVSQDHVRQGLTTVSLPGRFQVVPGEVEQILDVGHNPHAAAALAQGLRYRPCRGRTLAVIGMLADKDVEGVARCLAGEVDVWYAAGLLGERGLPADILAERLAAGGAQMVHTFPEVRDARAAALAEAQAGDRVVIFGSFYTVEQALKDLKGMAES